jgi:hypothetical protein
MHDHSLPQAVRRASRDLDPAALSNAPQRAGRKVAQHGIVPAREHGRHPVPVPAQQAFPDRVDAAVNGTQPVELHSMVDRPAAKTKL